MPSQHFMNSRDPVLPPLTDMMVVMSKRSSGGLILKFIHLRI